VRIAATAGRFDRVSTTGPRGRVAAALVRFAGVALLSAVAVVAAAWAGPSTPAWAGGAVVVGGDPADRSALGQPPSTVVLTFSDTPDDTQSHVTVWDAAQNSVDTGTLSASGLSLSQPVAIRASGNYTVAFHVVFTDGTETIGVRSFSVGTGVPPPLPPAALQQAAENAVQSGHDHGVDPASAVLLLVNVIVLGVIAFLLLRRPARRRMVVDPNLPDDDEEDDEPAASSIS
jgi:methionine-rich copper-binding protein CopC